MSIILELSPEEETAVRRAAGARGQEVADFVKGSVLAIARNVAPETDEDAEQARLRAIILSGAGMVKGTPRPDGRSWSEIEGFPHSEHDPNGAGQ